MTIIITIITTIIVTGNKYNNLTFGSQLFQHCVDNNVCAGATDLMMAVMTMTIDDDDSDADN